MHIHIPKPLHGWHDFLNEIGIIVIGVLIALGAESLIEQGHWRNQTAHTREALKADLYDGALHSWERLAVSRCLRGQLRDLLDGLDRSDGTWTGAPAALHYGDDDIRPIVPPAYAAPTRIFLGDAWRNALASGSLNHMPTDEVAHYSVRFAEMTEMNGYEIREAAAAARLAPLGTARHLDDRARADMIAAIAEVDSNALLLDLSAHDMLDELRRSHLGFDRRKIQRDRAAVLADQRQYRGACVAAVPLDLG